MTYTNALFLYVADPEHSGRFYTHLLELEPVETSPNFVLFVLPSGLVLGLWRRDDVQPAVMADAGGDEIGFSVQNAAEVDAIHDEWRSKGAVIAFPPTDLDFGRNFMALDPDGHRLRVYTLTEAK